MKKKMLVALTAVVLSGFMLAACGKKESPTEPAPVPTNTPVATATPNHSGTPNPTATAVVATPTPGGSYTPVPTATPVTGGLNIEFRVYTEAAGPGDYYQTADLLSYSVTSGATMIAGNALLNPDLSTTWSFATGAVVPEHFHADVSVVVTSTYGSYFTNQSDPVALKLVNTIFRVEIYRDGSMIGSGSCRPDFSDPNSTSASCGLNF